MTELHFVPSIYQRGRTQQKIVRCLIPYRGMLGKRYQVFSAQRLGVCRWQITFAKHWLRSWNTPPLMEKSFVEECKEYVYVRETQIVFPYGHVPPDALGPDCRVLGFSFAGLPTPHPEILSRYVRRIWYLSLNWRDGLLFPPDQNCVNPRGGQVRMLPVPQEHIERAKKRLEKYLTDRQAVEDGKVNYLGNWMTPEAYRKTRAFEEQNRRY
jgi:hypothetical protein